MKRPRPERAPAEGEDDEGLFRRAMRDVAPVRAPDRVSHPRTPPPPVPVQRIEDERAVIEELSRLAGGADDVEI